MVESRSQYSVNHNSAFHNLGESDVFRYFDSENTIFREFSDVGRDLR
jgi:hypothetical protein